MISAIPSLVPFINATNTSSTSLLLSWGETLKAEGYFISFKKADDVQNKAVQVNTSVLSYEIKGLEKFTWYNVSVQAFNQYGIGPVSEPVSCRTDEDGMSTLFIT